MNKTTIDEDRLQDFWAILQFHTLSRWKFHELTPEKYGKMNNVARANCFFLPEKALKKLGYVWDKVEKRKSYRAKEYLAVLQERNLVKEYHEKASRTYSSGKKFKCPAWIELHPGVLRRLAEEGMKELTAKQKKTVERLFKKKKTAKPPEEDDLGMMDARELFDKQEENMTKTEKENLRRECAAGLHAFDADTLIKDQERKERRLRQSQNRRIEKIAAETARRESRNEEEYVAMQTEIDRLRKENEELKKMLGGTKAETQPPQISAYTPVQVENVPEEDITELAKTMDAVDSKIYPRLAEFVSRGLVEDDTAALIARLYTGKRTTYRANRGYCQNDSWDVRVSRRKIYGRLIEELKSFSVTGENSWLIDTVKHRLENSFTLGLGGVKWFDEHWAMKIAEEQKTEESK